MNSNIFLDGKGPLYRQDPRAKVLTVLFACGFVFTPVSFYAVMGFGIFLVLLTNYSLGRKNAWTIFRSVLPMLIIMLLFSPLYERDGIILLSYGSSVILTKEGLLQSLLLDFRFLSITFACSLLFTTTKMDEFMLALQAFHLPYKACLTISLVFRSIPSIFDSFNQIIDSHKLRRAVDKKESTKLSKRLRNLFPTLTSALVVSLRSIPTLAMSLEARGYGLRRKRSNFHNLKKYKHPILNTLVSLSVFVLMFVVFKY